MLALNPKFISSNRQRAWEHRETDYPNGFAMGESIEQFLRHQIRISKGISQFVKNVQNGSLDELISPPSFDASDYVIGPKPAKDYPLPTGFAVTETLIPARLEALFCFSACLVCLFRNIEENRNPAEAVSIRVDLERLMLECTNAGIPARARIGAARKDEIGTESSLRFYIREYAPDRISELEFPKDAINNRWITRVPLPPEFKNCHH